MPKPKFSTHKPPRLKRSKGTGAVIAKDASKRKDVVTDGNASQSNPPPQAVLQLGNRDEIASHVAERVRQFESFNSASTPDVGHDRLKKALLEDIKLHNKLVHELCIFSAKDLITRREIVSLTDIVSVYTELGDIEVKIAREYKKISYCAQIIRGRG